MPMRRLLDKFFTDYESETIPEKRLDILLDFINYYNYSNFEHIVVLLKKELKTFKEQNYYDGQALIGILFTYYSFEKGDFNKVDLDVKEVMKIPGFPPFAPGKLR